MTDCLLQAIDLRLSYRRPDAAPQTVLQNFSLSLKPSEVVAILGPSGVGKSSLLRVLAGLQKADHGTVRFRGEDLRGPHPRSSFVFQDPSLLPWLSLEENVTFGLDFKHQPQIGKAEKQKRVLSAIEEVGLLAARGRYPAELSGGMAQRTALARSLTRQPEILLLDEPFSALDEITRADMQTLLQRITARHGTAAILVTHDIDEAMILADRIVLLGGSPASAVGEWPIAEDHPRDPSTPTLAQLRPQIVGLLRRQQTTAAFPHIAQHVPKATITPPENPRIDQGILHE